MCEEIHRNLLDISQRSPERGSLYRGSDIPRQPLSNGEEILHRFDNSLG